jgi:sugar lactone lactonase YvrE
MCSLLFKKMRLAFYLLLLFQLLTPSFINVQARKKGIGDESVGIITTVAGDGIVGFSGDGGPATIAKFSFPNGVAVDKNGNLFIADSINNRVRRVDTNTGIITTVAGNGCIDSSQFPCPMGDDGPAINATLSIFGFRGRLETGLTVDESGNLFIADKGNYHVRRVDASTNLITTIAGSCGFCSRNGFELGDGFPATRAIFDPSSIALDKNANLFIGDSYNRIRRVDSATSIITTIAGNNKRGSTEDGISSTAARLDLPTGLTIDRFGNLFFVDAFSSIKRIDATTNVITRVAGNGKAGFNGDGGLAINAELNKPIGMAIDGGGNLFIADSENNRIRRVDTATGIINTIAGSGIAGFFGDDGPATEARLDHPVSVAIDQEGNLFIADNFNHRIRVVRGIAKGKKEVGIGPARKVTITNVSFINKSLTITGTGFGLVPVQLRINDRDFNPFSYRIGSQTDNLITIKGNKKKLNLTNGENKITLISGGAASNTFIFK